MKKPISITDGRRKIQTAVSKHLAELVKIGAIVLIKINGETHVDRGPNFEEWAASRRGSYKE